MKADKNRAGKPDLDRKLTVEKEELKQLTVKTGLRAGLKLAAVGPCSGCHCMAAS